MKRLSVPVLLLVAFVSILVVGDRAWVRVSAVVACVPPDTLDAKHSWPAGATVAVTISGFPQNLQGCVELTQP
jgi:hypothetical protein